MGWNSASKIQIVKTSTFHQKGSFHHTTWHVLFKGQLHDENMVVFFRHSKTKGFRHYAGCILPTYRRVKFKHDHKFHRNFPKTVPNFHISNLFCLCRFLMTSFSFKKKSSDFTSTRSLSRSRCSQIDLPTLARCESRPCRPSHGPTWSLSHPTPLRNPKV